MGRVHTYTYKIPVIVPTIVDLWKTERWVVQLLPFHWRRRRGDWPSHWRRHNPPWPGPIFRYWHAGPVRVERFRGTDDVS